MKSNNKRVQRGEIYWCDLGEAVGSEQGGCRPVIIVQNDIGNNYSTTTIVVPLTTKIKKTKLPTHHEFINNGVKQVACAEQIRTVDKLRLGTNLGFVRKEDVDKISRCVHIAVEEIKFQPKQAHKNAAVPSREVKEEYALEHKDRSDFVNRTIYPEPKQSSARDEDEEIRDIKDLREPQEVGEIKGIQEVREVREVREIKDISEEKDVRKVKQVRETKSFVEPPKKPEHTPTKPQNTFQEKNKGTFSKGKRHWEGNEKRNVPTVERDGEEQPYRGKHSYKNRKKIHQSNDVSSAPQGRQQRKNKDNFKKEEGKM